MKLMENVKFYVAIFPVLLLLIPLSINQALLTVFLFFIFTFIIYNDSREKQFFRFDKQTIICSIFVDIVLAVYFLIRWSPFSFVEKLSSLLHINKTVFLIISCLLLAVLSFYGICKLLSLIVYYIKHFDKSRLFYWLMNRSNTTRQKVVISFVLAVFVLLIQGSLPIYSDIDNVGISLVLNGAYSSENICLFVSPILSIIVKAINILIPFADGYIFFMELALTFGFGLLFYILFSIEKHNLSIMIFYVLFLSICLLLNIYHANFTLYTAMLCVVGLIGVFAFWQQKVGVCAFIFSVCVFEIGCLFRFEGMLLLLPFALVTVVFELLSNRKQIKLFLPRLAIVLLAVFVCVLGNWLINTSVANSDKYLSSQIYSSARHQIFDYKTKDWVQIENELEQINISENDYNALKMSILADTDRFTSDSLDNISKISKLSLSESLNEMPNKLQEVFYVSQNDLFILLSIVLSIFVLLFFALFTSIKILRVLEILIGYLLVIVLVVLFAAIGRIPARVIYSIILGGCFIILAVLIVEQFELCFKSKALSVFLIGVELTFLLFTYSSVEKVNGGFVFNSLIAQANQNETLDDGNKYVWGTNDFNQFVDQEFLRHNKLPTKQFLNNNINDGKWAYGQVYFQDYLSRNRITNPMKSLVENNTYYVSDKQRCDMVLAYLKENYSAKISVSKIDEIEGIPIWKFCE